MGQLTESEIETLKRQGLQADIRNQLGPAKNLTAAFQAWKNEENLGQKNILLQFIENDMKQLEKSVEHICDSFQYFEITVKK